MGYAHLEERFDVDLLKKMVDVVISDKKPEFLSLMELLYQDVIISKTGKVGKEELDGNEAKYCPPLILQMIFQYGALDCAIAFFQGETGFITDLNVPFVEGLYPLHLAANFISYEMVELLLFHGARTDIRTIEGRLRGNLLPLNVSLETVSYHRYLIDWTPEQSIFKLIIVLCLPQMKVPLEINRLLALRTNEVDKVFNHYAMGGRLIEMATMLMVAREKIKPLSMFESKDGPNINGSMSICKSINEEIESLMDDKIKLIGSHENGKLVWQLKDIKAVMTQGLLLLKVFEKVGAAVEKYRQSVQNEVPKEKVVNDIKELLESSGFVLKDKDLDLSDIDCESEDIKVATKVLGRTTFGSHSKDLYMPFDSLSGSFPKDKSSVPNGIRRLRSVQTFLSDGHFVFQHPLGDAYSVGSGRPKAMRVSAGYLLSINQFTSFALAIKKGITRI